MPAEIDASNARTHLRAPLERIARGEQVTIAKRGRPIARLVPIERTSPDRRREAIEQLKRLREHQTLEVSVKLLIREGQRSRMLCWTLPVKKAFADEVLE
jgi:prevent-host-death family protein